MGKESGNRLMKFLVVGSNGFLGSSISTLLKKNNEKVVNINRQTFLAIRNNSTNSIEIGKKFDAIIFCAAKVPSTNQEDFEENMKLVNEFIKLIEGISFKYILNLSSDAVYADFSRPISETDLPNPSTPHGIMHFFRETILKTHFKEKMGNLRPTLVYGPGDTHNSYGPNRFIRDGLAGRPIQVIGKGEELRDHIYINDVAEIALAMLKTRTLGDLNAATGKINSFMEIAQIVHNSIPKSKITFVKRVEKKLPHNGYRAFNVSKLNILNLNRNITNLDCGIKLTIMKTYN